MKSELLRCLNITKTNHESVCSNHIFTANFINLIYCRPLRAGPQTDSTSSSGGWLAERAVLFIVSSAGGRLIQNVSRWCNQNTGCVGVWWSSIAPPNTSNSSLLQDHHNMSKLRKSWWRDVCCSQTKHFLTSGEKHVGQDALQLCSDSLWWCLSTFTFINTCSSCHFGCELNFM